MSSEKMDATGRTEDGKKHTASWEHAVKFSGWATPIVQDIRHSGLSEHSKHDKLVYMSQQVSGPPQSGTPAETGKQGGYRLNPMFSLYLQGYPLSWGISGFLAAISLKRKR
jgi:hypothetical protein